MNDAKHRLAEGLQGDDIMKSQESKISLNAQNDSPRVNTEVTEQKRLKSTREEGVPWKKWGPYLSERQWGRE